jgi:hypothetical protein
MMLQESDQQPKIHPNGLCKSHIQSVEEYQALVFEHRRGKDWNPTPLDWKIDRAYADYRNFKVWTFRGEHFLVCSFLKDRESRVVFWGNYVAHLRFRGRGLVYPIFKAEYDRLVTKGYCVIACTVFSDTPKYVLKLKMRVVGRVQSFSLLPKNLKASPFEANVTSATLADLPEIVAFDYQISNRHRQPIWTVFLNDTNLSVFIYRESGRVSGFGVLLPGISDYQLGPLYSDNTQVAHAIIATAVKQVPPTHRMVLDALSPTHTHSKTPFFTSLGLQASVEFEVIASDVLAHDIMKTFAIFHYDMGL